MHSIAMLRRQLFERSGELIDGPVSVQSLGSLKLETAGAWTTTMLYPIGYETRTIVDGIAWRCHIEPAKDDPKKKPMFQVQLEQAPAISFRSNAASRAWSKAMAFLHDASEEERDHWRDIAATTEALADGEDGFGLERQSIARTVEGLDHVLGCDGYLFWDERHPGCTREGLAKQKRRVTKQLEAWDEARMAEKARIRETARQWLEEEKAQLQELKAQHEQEQATKKKQAAALKAKAKATAQQASMQKKIEALRQRRQLLKDQGSLRSHGINLHHLNPRLAPALLQFVDDELAKREELAAAHVAQLAKVAAYTFAQAHVVANHRPTPPAAQADPVMPSAATTPLEFLEAFPPAVQVQMLWLWDFFYQYADVLRLRAVPPLAYFCNVVALHDGSLPNGESVMEEMSHGRCLATLHVVLLDVLLQEYTPYLQMTVAEYKRTRPLNALTWVEVARHVCMVAVDVARGDMDGNYIKMLKGSKSSYESSVLPLRESLHARGQALQAATTQALETPRPSLAEVDAAPPVVEACYSVVMDAAMSGLTWDEHDGHLRVATITDAADATVREKVAVGDLLLCLNGTEIPSQTTVDQLQELAAAATDAVGCIFSKGDLAPPLPKKASSQSSSSRLKRLTTVLRILQAKEAAVAFNHPVDTDLYPDYASVIAEPMDFSTIEDKIRDNEYDGDDEVDGVIDDVHLIWKNCFEYNGEQADISKLARKLSAAFERLCRDFVFGDAPGLSVKAEDSCRQCHCAYLKGQLLLCDRCDAPYHSVCVSPPLTAIPKGEWYCPDCAPLQPPPPEKSDADEDEAGQVESGPALVVRLLSKENYAELTLDDRLLVLQTLCELVQGTAAVQSILRIVEDHAEDERRGLAASFAECHREWQRFGQLRLPSLRATPTLTIDGVARELTDDLLAHLKARCVAELEGGQLPPPYDFEGEAIKSETIKTEPAHDAASKDAMIVDDADDTDDTDEEEDLDAILVETYGDAKLAARVAPAQDKQPVAVDDRTCVACHLPEGPVLGALETVLQAPETLRLSTSLHEFHAPTPDVAWTVGLWAEDAAPFDACVLESDGQLSIAGVHDASGLSDGDLLLGFDCIQVPLGADPAALHAQVHAVARPMALYTCPKGTVVPRDSYAVVRLPNVPLEVPELVLAGDATIHLPSTLSGFTAISGAFFPWDVVVAINGTRVTTVATAQELWRPQSTVLVARRPFPRRHVAPPPAPLAPDAVAAQILQCHSYDVQFQPGPLGLALELERHKVYVRSLTAMSQATAAKSIQPGDIIVSLQGKPLGQLQELTDFTDLIRRLPRPITLGFARPGVAAPPTTTPPPHTTSVLAAQLLRCDVLEFDGRLVVRHTGGVHLPGVAPGDSLVQLNRVDIRGMRLAWLHQLLQQLPLEKDLEVTVAPRIPADLPVAVHPACVDHLNTALAAAEELHAQLQSTAKLEEFLMHVGPRTTPVANEYFHFGGDPRVLYRRHGDHWTKITHVAAYTAALTDRALAARLDALVAPRPLPKTGPFSMRPLITPLGDAQFEAFVMYCGRQYFLGSFGSTADAEKAYSVCCLRYESHQQFLSPFTNASFPRLPLPTLKAEETLRRLSQARRYEPSLTLEMQSMLRYGIRAKPPPVKPPVARPPPKQSPLPVSAQQQQQIHHQHLQQQYQQQQQHIHQQYQQQQQQHLLQQQQLAKKRPTPASSPPSTQPSPSHKRQKVKESRLLQQIQALDEHKSVVSQAWAALYHGKSAETTAGLISALQNTLTALNVLAQHVSRHPGDAPSPHSFVALHHAVVMVIMSILLMQATGKAAGLLSPVELQVVQSTCVVVLSALDATMAPSRHDDAIAKCVAFEEQLAGWVAHALVSPDVQTILGTIQTFFLSSLYLKDAAGNLQSNSACRPLFAMLNTAQPKHITPLPIMLTQELWKLQTCQNSYEKQVKKLLKGSIAAASPPPEPTKPHENPGAIPKYPASAQPNGVPPANPSPDDVVVSFTHGPLGIIIQQEVDSITVSSFSSDPQGQALKSGVVNIGDAIVAVNHEPVSVIGIEGFKQAVTSGIRPLLITFRRRANSVPQSKPPTPRVAEETEMPDSSGTMQLDPANAFGPLFDGAAANTGGYLNGNAAMGFFSRGLDLQPTDFGDFAAQPQQQLLMNPLLYPQGMYPTSDGNLWPADPALYAGAGANMYYNMYPPAMASSFPGFDILQQQQQQSSAAGSSADYHPTAAFFDPQFYNPQAFRAGPPTVEFVGAPAPPTASTPQAKLKKTESTHLASMSGRRSSRVSKKPDAGFGTALSAPNAPSAMYVPGAGHQGEWATDHLPALKRTNSDGHLLALLIAQLLAIEAALPRDAFRDGKWSAPLRLAWAEMVVHAGGAKALLEATFVLECHVDSEFLDAQWKAQALLTPKVLLATATLASAAMRIYALDDALSFVRPLKKAAPKRKTLPPPAPVRPPQSSASSYTGLPSCPELVGLHETVAAQARARMQASLAQPATTEVYQKTMYDLRALTQLPDAVLQRWYAHCREAVPLPADDLKRKLPTPAPVTNVAMKKAKLRGRKPKNLEYRYVLEAGHYGLPPAVAADSLLPDRLLWLLATLKKNPAAAPFLQPVDTTAIPTYAAVITCPMDLHTIETKLRQGAYAGQYGNLCLDMDRIWANCFAFNSKTAELSSLARRLRSVFHRLYESWVQQTPPGTPATALRSDEQCRSCKRDERIDEMLLCDSCDGAYHTFCIGLGEIPTGNWYCAHCVENRELH
ncbi:hypothetical protein ACHHYP_04865 [Achlya hypogyna]|uniref:Uncharacterized protein n=1 Tax=Achlya hypogyna TaxID=1202772 RepID=A0A1V9YZI7_ACHHY|nr:hypothetical protein ACHHYP_04865 [Achlya hypogyna]